MATQPLTNVQKNVKRAIDMAQDSCIAYAAPEVPPLGNATAEGLVEELGYLNSARKTMEKTEKILKERLKSLLGDRTEVRSPNFTMKYEDRERCALDQGKAKGYLEELGILPEYMVTTQVPTMTIKENG